MATGLVIPVLPGALLILGAIAIWAIVVCSTTGWIVLGASAALIGAAQIVKDLVPLAPHARRGDTDGTISWESTSPEPRRSGSSGAAQRTTTNRRLRGADRRPAASVAVNVAV